MQRSSIAGMIGTLNKKCEICSKDIHPKAWTDEFKLKFCHKHELEEREKEANRLAAKREEEDLDLQIERALNTLPE